MDWTFLHNFSIRLLTKGLESFQWTVQWTLNVLEIIDINSIVPSWHYKVANEIVIYNVWLIPSNKIKYNKIKNIDEASFNKA